MTITAEQGTWLRTGRTYLGDCTKLLPQVAPESVALSVWSPPYFVGKSYEQDLDLDGWKNLIRSTLHHLYSVIVPGGFVCVNIADILAFPDASIPKFQADLVSHKRCPVTRSMILDAQLSNPGANRYELAKILGCSEQTIQRRLEGNNIRGGKHDMQTRVLPVMGMVSEFASQAGFVLYDRRIWQKDPAWANSRWHSGSYRSVDEFEYILFFWKPGITKVDRKRLDKHEWSTWGSRGIWKIPSVRANTDHEAKYPIELPSRLIRLLTDPGETVLDPFMGSGTTGEAAIKLGRRYIGMELMPKYAELAEKNCAEARHEFDNRPRGTQE